MADDNKKVGYPRIARSVWFGLREKLKTRVPAEISPSYVAGIFQMEPASASSNVLPALRSFALIDDNNKPLDLAWDWRDDAKYPEVCQKIIETIYPQELRDLFHTSDASIEGVKGWFMRNARVGEAAANKFAITYTMLLEADLTKAAAPAQKTKASANVAPAKARPAKAKSVERHKPASLLTVANDPPSLANAGDGGRSGSGSNSVVLAPKLHIDVQIHISPESSADQIDKIFESMAKHLKDFRA